MQCFYTSTSLCASALASRDLPLFILRKDGMLQSGLSDNSEAHQNLVLHVRIRWNFAFVQFSTQEEATKALVATQRSKLLDRVVSVEYALTDNDERDDRYHSPRRGGGYGRPEDSLYEMFSSPAYSRRPSPDYGRSHSPVYGRYNGPE
ncbi:hypothetical protein V6N13_093550 [Hibiscus sabdariffa]|uniref:RRM domain-containing protein n=1 Tax=Hibiscus sabdariffa TaxID=183260 RepID=A0ABR2NFY2_9ROSI